MTTIYRYWSGHWSECSLRFNLVQPQSTKCIQWRASTFFSTRRQQVRSSIAHVESLCSLSTWRFDLPSTDKFPQRDGTTRHRLFSLHFPLQIRGVTTSQRILRILCCHRATHPCHHSHCNHVPPCLQRHHRRAANATTAIYAVSPRKDV